MTEAHAYTTDSNSWQIRQIQAVATDPLFSGAHFTFSVEAEGAGFEVTVRFSPIYCHLVGPRQRAALGATGLSLVRRLLELGDEHAAVVIVSSDGVARHGARLLQRLLA